MRIKGGKGFGKFNRAFVVLSEEYLEIIIHEPLSEFCKKIDYGKITSIETRTFTKISDGTDHYSSDEYSLNLNIKHMEDIFLSDIKKRDYNKLIKYWENGKTRNESSSSQESQPNNSSTNADELLKYAELYEKGLLTREEFDAKKKELL